MRKRVAAILLFAAISSVCLASGWHDYSLDIGDGYSIVRCNSLQIIVANAHGQILIGPDCDHYDDPVGPVVEYATTERFVFTRNLGKRARNLFVGDTFQDVDPTQEFFFILAKGTDAVTGSLTRQEFSSRPEVTAASPIGWCTPRNPNFWLPLGGDLLFLAYSIPILSVMYFWVTVPLVAAVILLIAHIRRRRKQRAQPRGGA
jgi:hypothetical protein